MHIERLCIECLRLICITLSIVRRFLQYPMADQLWHLVCSQVRIPGAAGWIPGVRQVNWSQFMHIERLCIERHCIERHCIVCFLFRPCLRSSWSGLFACVVAPDLHRGLHLSTAHRRTTVHLNAYACHCKIRLYPLIFLCTEIDCITEMHLETFQHWKLLADRVGTLRLSNTESYLRIELEVFYCRRRLYPLNFACTM